MEKGCKHCCVDNDEEGCALELQSKLIDQRKESMGSEALTFWKNISKGSIVEVNLAILVAPRRNGVLCTTIKKLRRVWYKGTAQLTSDFGKGEITSDSRNLKEDVLSTHHRPV